MFDMYGNSQQDEIILGFMYEPELSVGESPTDNFEDDKNDDNVDNTVGREENSAESWCSCGKCIRMPTRKECLCCRELNGVVENFNIEG